MLPGAKRIYNRGIFTRALLCNKRTMTAALNRFTSTSSDHVSNIISASTPFLITIYQRVKYIPVYGYDTCLAEIIITS